MEPIPCGFDKQVFIDGRFLDTSSGIEFVVHPPRKADELCIEPNGDWEERIGAYNTVIFDGDCYRLWYTFFITEGNGVAVGYAESDDGRNWKRPRLRYATELNTESNVVAGFGANGIPGPLQDGTLHVFHDTKSAGDRFAMLLRTSRGGGISLFTSDDGTQWRPTGVVVLDDKRGYDESGAFVGKEFHLDSQNVVFYDERIEKYVAYVRRNFDRRGQVRTIARDEAETLDLFADPGKMPVVLAADSLDPLISALGGTRDAHRVDFYTNATVRYADAADAYYMFPSIYHKYDGWFEESYGEEPLNSGPLDARFAASRDGINWHRFDRRAFVPLGRMGAFDSASIYMACGVVPGTDDDLYMYYNGSNLLHGHARPDDRRERNDRILNTAGFGVDKFRSAIARLELRVDGFVSLRSAYTGGAFATPLILTEGSELRLNVDTGAVGYVRVEIQDANGVPLPGCGFSESIPIHSVNDTSVRVAFKNATSIKSSGRPIRICIRTADTDIYSFGFVSQTPNRSSL